MSFKNTKLDIQPTYEDTINWLKEIVDHPSGFSIAETTTAIAHALHYLELYNK